MDKNHFIGAASQGGELGAKPEAKIDELSDRDARRDQLVSVEEHTFAFFRKIALEAKEQLSKGGGRRQVFSSPATRDGRRSAD